MATPTNSPSMYDAIYDWSGLQVFNYVRDNFNPHDTTILDVGAGWGKYSYLLPDYEMDANEIWGAYITDNLLWRKYHRVIHGDICSLELKHYNIVIMGDVLEHIERKRAQDLIERLADVCDEVIVAVPFEYEQHATDDNIYEEHLQPDLTPELMEELYPRLRLLAKSGNKGIYIKR